MKMRLLIFVSLTQLHILFSQPPAAASSSSARPRAAAAAALYADEQNNPKEGVEEEGYAQKLLTSAFPDIFRPAEPSCGPIPAAAAGAAGAGMGRQAPQNQPAQARAAAAAAAGSAQVGVRRAKAKSIGKESQANIYKVGVGPTIGLFSSRDSLAVLNSGSNSLNIFTMDRRTGILHEVQGSPFQTSRDPVLHPCFLSFSADGNTLAIGNGLINNSMSSSSIDIYRIDNQTGLWQAIKGSPFNMRRNVEGLALSPNGSKLVVSYGWSNPNIPNIIMYHIDHQKAELTPFLQLNVPGRIMGLSVSPNGNILACYGLNSVNILGYNAQTGSFMPVQGSPFNMVGVRRLSGYSESSNKMSFSGDGSVLAVANQNYKRVEIFVIDKQTNMVSHVPFNLEFASHSVSLSSNEGLLAISNWRKPYKVGIYIVDIFSGKLKALQESPFTMKTPPVFASLSSNGRFLAVASSAAPGAEDRSGTVSMYGVDSVNGAIELKRTEAEQKQLKEALIDTAILPQEVVKGPLYEYLYGPEHVVPKQAPAKEMREEIRERDAQKKLMLTQHQRANQENDRRALFKAIAEANVNGVSLYLTPFTVNARADEDGRTPLMRAVSVQAMAPAQSAIARKILNYVGFKYHTLYKEQAEEVKPNLELTDNFGNTALKLAEIHEHTILAKEIRDKMAAENPSVGGKRKRS